VPQENSIFGAVIETDDLLRLPIAGRDLFVVGEVTLGIQHYLIVRKGVQLEEIETVLSHEQALGQCRKFISENIPGASTVKMASTSAAAQALSTSPTKNINPFKSAAICSKMTVTIFDGLETLREGVQDAEVNFTRFYILSTCLSPKNVPSPKEASPMRALVRLSSPPVMSIPATPPSPPITRLLLAINLLIIRLDRRPSVDPLPFHDVYLVELQQEVVSRDSIHQDAGQSWIEEVQAGLQRVKTIGGEATLLGIW
jgi:hypothetical protein